MAEQGKKVSSAANVLSAYVAAPATAVAGTSTGPQSRAEGTAVITNVKVGEESRAIFYGMFWSLRI